MLLPHLHSWFLQRHYTAVHRGTYGFSPRSIADVQKITGKRSGEQMRRRAICVMRIATSVMATGALLLLLACSGVTAISGGDPSKASRPATLVAQYLYASAVTASYTGVLIGYAIDADGALTPLDLRINTPEPVVGLTQSPDGTFVFATSGHAIVTLRVNKATGNLRIASSLTLPNHGRAFSLTISPTGTLLFATVEGTGGVHEIATLSIAPSGKLQIVAVKPLNWMNGGMAVNPAGTFLYVDTAGTTVVNFTITQLSIDIATGALTVVDTFVGPDFSPPSSLVIHPADIALYQGIGQVPVVATFSVMANTGQLSFLNWVSCECDAGPDFGGPIAINVAGTVLFSSTFQDAGVALYTVANTGELTPISGSFVPAAPDIGPVTYTIDSTGNFLYINVPTTDTISAYSVTNSAAVTSLGSFAVPSGLNVAALRVIGVRR